ncbi:VOC family protein [Castellaniella defragrans]|uniref:VOC family protein n=1 Tax=Castellaniella defragrans TaxID=75697 RepID=UPI0023F01356|nr:VOC family protein [Castellaniella defragrans]
MLATLEGLDHVVVTVRDLDAAAGQWRALGFTLSPRGTHSAHLGTGNYTLMFEDDYLELLGILQATELNAPSRDFLARRGQGLEQAAFRTRDAAAGAAALARQGIQAVGPVDFSRPVSRPDGGRAEAAFSIFNWPPDQRPADLRIFACQHHTREAVWLPELTRHANTVAGIRRVEAIAADPAAAARTLGALLDAAPETTAAGARIRTGPGRADIHFMTADAFAQAYALPAGVALPAQGAAALALRVRDLEAAARCAGPAAWRTARGVALPPDLASGVLLAFEAD